MSFATDTTAAPRSTLTGNAAELFVCHLIFDCKRFPIISIGDHKTDAMLEEVLQEMPLLTLRCRITLR
jgi:hypothetical protein